jgi:hypothetical protein
MDSLDITGPVDVAGKRIKVSAKAGGTGAGSIEVQVSTKDFAFGVVAATPPEGSQLGDLPFAFEPDASAHLDPYASGTSALVSLGNPVPQTFRQWVYGDAGATTGWFRLYTTSGNTEHDDPDVIIIGPP